MVDAESDTGNSSPLVRQTGMVIAANTRHPKPMLYQPINQGDATNNEQKRIQSIYSTHC